MQGKHLSSGRGFAYCLSEEPWRSGCVVRNLKVPMVKTLSDMPLCGGCHDLLPTEKHKGETQNSTVPRPFRARFLLSIPPPPRSWTRHPARLMSHTKPLKRSNFGPKGDQKEGR